MNVRWWGSCQGREEVTPGLVLVARMRILWVAQQKGSTGTGNGMGKGLGSSENIIIVLKICGM